MFGDRSGSPRRDDRQSSGPAQPPGPSPEGPEAPHEDDVRVAGTGPRAGVPAGDTLGLQPLQEPLRTGVSAGGPADEISSGPGGPRRAGRKGGSGARKGGPAGRKEASGGRNGVRIAVVAAGAAVLLGGGAVAAFALTGGSGDEGPQTVEPTRQLADAAVPKIDPKVLEQQRKKLALERASRATRQDGGKKGPSLLPKGKPIPTKTPEPKKTGGSGGGPTGDPVPAGEAQAIAKRLMPSYGFTGSGQFGCLVNLWNKESHWNVHASNPSSGAYGVPQALPGDKMASAGPDWRNNPTTQIKWGLGYIKNRYGTPCGAWSHSQSVGWY